MRVSTPNSLFPGSSGPAFTPLPACGRGRLWPSAYGVDFRDALAEARDVGHHFRAEADDFACLHPHAAGDVDAAVQLGEARLDLFGRPLAIDGALEERLQHREQRLRFFESEGHHEKFPAPGIRQKKGKCDGFGAPSGLTDSTWGGVAAALGKVTVPETLMAPLSSFALASSNLVMVTLPSVTPVAFA